jgi:polysaccharide deacetylase family protein (PEP-CTERM system associated)
MHTPKPRVTNVMSVDVEDYFQVQAFAGAVSRTEWEHLPRRVEGNTERILTQFEAAAVHATFFTLGWVAERHKTLIRRIVAAGHELASHGYDHVLADRFTPAQFGEDVRRSKLILENIAGVPVIGYRAPTFSIGPRNPWAFEQLAGAGYRYSSSVFPIRHDLYGAPDAPRAPFQPVSGGLWEFPMTTVRLFARNLPCSGGGYFRLLPYRLFRAGLGRVNHAERRPGIFYFHPWEIDPDQPRLPGCSARARFRHFVNMRRMYGRVDRLLRDFAWDRMDRVFAPLLQLPCVPGG